MASNSLGFVWAGRDIVSSHSHWVRIISPDPADQVPVDCLFRLSAFDGLSLGFFGELRGLREVNFSLGSLSTSKLFCVVPISV